MSHTFDIIKQTRENFIGILAGLTLEQVNKIPTGFNNNIIWNLGHIVASQQVLCYKLAGLEPRIDLALLSRYGKGSRPEKFIGAAELDLLKLLAVSQIEDLKMDHTNGIFKTFTEYPTSYGVKLCSIDDAIRFVAVHEGLHFGYALALKRAVS